MLFKAGPSRLGLANYHHSFLLRVVSDGLATSPVGSLEVLTSQCCSLTYIVSSWEARVVITSSEHHSGWNFYFAHMESLAEKNNCLREQLRSRAQNCELSLQGSLPVSGEDVVRGSERTNPGSAIAQISQTFIQDVYRGISSG